MLNMQSNRRVYTQQDFDTAQGVERIVIHLDNPRAFPLSPTERRHFERLRVVFGVMMACNTQRDRIRRISQVIAVSEKSIRRYMDEATMLFGDLMAVDARFEKNFLKEKLYGLAKKAEEAGDIETAVKCLDRVIKISGYDREDGGLKPGDIQMPTIIFTSNPKALTEPNYDEAVVLESEAIRVPAK